VGQDPTTRFSDRVDAYVRYRPSYPHEIFELLEAQCGLDSPRSVADIGSGTGILTRLFLERGHAVHGVEPNRSMRIAAERLLAGFKGFTSVEGTAESTTLATDSVHLIATAQAFHWFDRVVARREFERLLKPDGWVAIVWNDRRKSSTPFLQAYEGLLLNHGTDYHEVDHTRVGHADLLAFFGPQGYQEAHFDNHQVLDFESLQGRLESSSYAPQVGTPGYQPMIEDLRHLFDTHNADGLVSLDYDTRVYYGQLGTQRPSPTPGRSISL